MADKNYTTAPSSRQTLNGQGVRRISGSVMKIATWNVRSLFAPGKLENSLKEMKRLGINLLGISDTKWIGSGSRIVDDDKTMIYFSGKDDNSNCNNNNSRDYRYGVAIIVDDEVN